MLKYTVLAGLLFASPLALACGGKPCGHCGDTHASAEVEDISKAPGTHVTLNVTGMKCGACGKKVRAALEGVDGVNAVSVDHSTGTTKVAFDASKTNTDALIKAIEALSFHAELATEQG